MITFDELREANVARCNEVFHNFEDWSAADWATALAGEVGELCNLIKKLRRGEEIDTQDIADEIADVQIYLDLLAEHFKIDLEIATIKKFNEVSLKRGATVYLNLNKEK